MRKPLRFLILPLTLLGVAIALTASSEGPPFRAGASIVDINPGKFPVRVNAMFTERSGGKVVDPLTARALAMDDGKVKIVFCVVDTCMMARDLIDAAKKQASEATGIPADKMLVSATHTHSAPSAMGCLGSRIDPEYAAMLPGKISEAIIAAVKNLQPARVGWTSVDDWEHTFNRRWIRRPDRMLTDPFGKMNVRANMHPGHQSPDAVGPSGPVDPGLSLLAAETLDGKPLALLANYSMHYYGSDLLSSDYFGRFAKHFASQVGAPESFVGIMSQGTSGDLMWMDYGSAKKEIGYDAYAREMATVAAAAYRKIEWHTSVPLRMEESKLALDYRVPDAERLAWAQEMVGKVGDRLPQSLPEIYAAEAIHLHERQKTELILQAVRIGDLGITALPNEVFAITGLKLKAQSPFATTFNMELANGAEGYIPPPEQHALGGYTTWPARTAGLEVQAEPKIVEASLKLLEGVAGKPRRALIPAVLPYVDAVMASKPDANWHLDEMAVPTARGVLKSHDATLEDGVAVYLPGFDDAQPPKSHAYHFAGGRMKADVKMGDTYSVEMWLWNGLAPDARAVTGYAFSRGPEGDPQASGEHLGIGGTFRADIMGKLILFNGNARDELLVGHTILAQKAWHHVVLVREGDNVRVHLDGHAQPELSGKLAHTVAAGVDRIFFGGRNDGLYGWEGKLDEPAIYQRALTAQEIAAHYRAGGVITPPTFVNVNTVPSAPLSPQQAIQKIHVPNGFAVECVAHEPQTMDPIAIDWDLAGRMWVVEMADYPLGLDGKGKAGGRVRVLEDVDGDGTYEKSTLFAEGLNFPTGLLIWRDGVIVTAAPEILFLKDSDGDGKADVREVLLTGLSQGNQQLRANGLRWGLDNWVYCAAGGHHGGFANDTKLSVTKTGQVIPVGSRDFRFKPDTMELEPESGPSQFGRNRDDYGHWFGTQNSRALWHYVLPDAALSRNPYVPAPDPTKLVVTPLNAAVWPLSPPEKRYHSFENASHFTSACSGMIYRDELLFPRRAGEMDSFTCEPFHNLVQHNIVVDEGVSYTFRRAAGEEQSDFFVSEDRWCRPVMTRTGPDGALWVVDMYRFMIEHPDWLPENGKAELLPHYRLGEDKGRIYRVFPSTVARRKIPRLDKMNTEQLVAALDSPNEWQRDKAHMALVWKNDDSAYAPLMDATLKSQNPLARIHALAVLDGTTLRGSQAMNYDRTNPDPTHANSKARNAHDQRALGYRALEHALKDEDPRVRENAIRLVGQLVGIHQEFQSLADDDDGKVRLALALAIGEFDETSQFGVLLGKIAAKDYADPYMRAAIMSSAVHHCIPLCESLAVTGGPALSAFTSDLISLALGLGNPEALDQLLKPSLEAKDGKFTAAQITAVQQFLATLGKQKPELLEAWLAKAAASLEFARNVLTDEAADPSLPIAAARLLLQSAKDREDTIKVLTDWLAPNQSSELQVGAVQALVETGENEVPAILFSQGSVISPVTRSAALAALLSREAWAIELLEYLKSGASVPLDAAQKAQLKNHPAQSVKDFAAQVFAGLSSRQQVIAQFQPALKLAGDVKRGHDVYFTRCIGCHQRDGQGNQIGPDLVSVVNHPPEKILTNILDPSADVQPGFDACLCALADGTTLYGLITSETGNSVTFKFIDGTTRLVSRREIKSIKSTGISLMPEGLEAGLEPQEMADLIAYVKSSGTANATAATGAAADLRVGAAAENFSSDNDMPLAGYLESRFTKEQEGELRAVAVVVEKPAAGKVAIVTCDVLWVTKPIVDAALAEIEKATGIPPANVLVNATHTHHAPGTAPAHGFGFSPKFAAEVQRAIVQSVKDANSRLIPGALYYQLGEERTVGANSRLLLDDGCISWLNPAGEAGLKIQPTGPFDPQLPVMDFRAANGNSIAVIFNHSTHTIGTRSGRDVRSASFYGLAAQDLEKEFGGIYSFIEGASGSTHNVRGVPVPEAIDRMKRAVTKARTQAATLPIARIAALKQPFTYKMRTFDEKTEDAKVVKYLKAHAPASADRIQEIFADSREKLRPAMGQERTTWLQVIALGDIAIVGVPAEYFTTLGLDIKARSPFKHTIIAELANDWIGYLPDRAGQTLGGYQTWTGLHSDTEPGTGERIADEAIKMLQQLQ